MRWMMLTPRQLEAVRTSVGADDARPNAVLLRRVQGLVRGDELELTDAELNAVQAAARDYRGGFEKAFQAVLGAWARHG